LCCVKERERAVEMNVIAGILIGAVNESWLGKVLAPFI